jgi:hypothetical protein
MESRWIFDSLASGFSRTRLSIHLQRPFRNRMKSLVCEELRRLLAQFNLQPLAGVRFPLPAPRILVDVSWPRTEFGFRFLSRRQAAT